MITDSFDNKSNAIINPRVNEAAPKVDACILTFSHVIEEFVLSNYICKQIATIWFATGATPIYRIEYQGKAFAFYKTYVGAPACVASLEDSLSEINTDKYIVFGGAGCLNKEITHGKVMIPTEAYRDEGTSYHYAPASDYIIVKNAETVNNFNKHKADGCISVEMECAALQAMCDFRGLNFYTFFTSGGLTRRTRMGCADKSRRKERYAA